MAVLLKGRERETHVSNAGWQARSLEEVDGSLQSELVFPRRKVFPNMGLKPTTLRLRVSSNQMKMYLSHALNTTGVDLRVK